MQKLRTLGFLVGGVLLALSGSCYAFRGNIVQVEYRAELPNGAAVTLVQEAQQDALSAKGNYAALRLCVFEEDGAVIDEPVAHRTGSFDDVPWFEFGRLEARASEDLNRVWFIDVSTSRIIATVDIRRGVVTGANDVHPSWATASGGAVVRSTNGPGGR